MDERMENTFTPEDRKRIRAGIPDKMKALKEVCRVLKPNGRFMLADQVLTIEPPADTKSMVENWVG